MSSAKSIPEEDTGEEMGPDDEQGSVDNGAELAESIETKKADKSKKPASTGKRPLGTKEVIPFEWKLVGVSQGIVLTLFKAVERADVDAQYERVKREGYYTDLRILNINEEVKQPKPPKPAAKDTTVRRTRRTAKTTKKPPVKAAKGKHTVKAAAAPSAAKKSAKKANVKGASKKKKASAKSGKKKQRASP